jgi:hypothetical protein
MSQNVPTTTMMLVRTASRPTHEARSTMDAA